MGVLGLTWLVLAAPAAGLSVYTLVTAAPPAGGVPDRAQYARRWSALHGGYDPRGTLFTGRWLALVATLARPLAARGVRPGALTGWGLWAAAAVVALAAGHGRWPLLGVLAVVGSGILDNLDGAVAVLSGRSTRFGYVLDSLADRLADTAYVLALWFLGAPGWPCVLAAGLAALQEYTRARAGNAGMGEIGVVTVWERPTRVILSAFLLLGCGLLPARADLFARSGAAAWCVLGAVGCVQVLAAVRAALAPDRDATA